MTQGVFTVVSKPKTMRFLLVCASTSLLFAVPQCLETRQAMLGTVMIRRDHSRYQCSILRVPNES